MEENMKTEGSDLGVYEVGFLIVPHTTEEKLPEVFGSIKELISEKGGFPIGEEFPKLMTLAYTMDKTINNKIERFKEGYFGWIKFEMAGAGVQSVEAALRLRTDVIRHLLVSTVRENTIAAKRGFGVRRRSKEDMKDKEAAPLMSKEEIDREIEALVDTTEAA